MQHDHCMTADQIRGYAAAAAALDEWGAKWQGLVRCGLRVGMTAEEIAEFTGMSVEDVLAALHLPVVLAQMGSEEISRAISNAELGPDDSSEEAGQ